MEDPPVAATARMGRIRSSRCTGFVLIYVMVALVAFSAVLSLAVDWGQVQLSKTELRRTVDAAARYALSGMSDGTACQKANWIAGQNLINGRALTFASADVEVGTWDTTTQTFTPTNINPMAVRVTASTTVPAVFGPIIGVNSTSIRVQTVATLRVVGYGIVGLNYISMTGNSTDSYWASGGGPPLTNGGNIGSNGNVTLNGSSTIHGNVYYLPGKTVTGGSITGTKNLLSSPLVFSTPDSSWATSYQNTNDNGNLTVANLSASKDLTVGNNKTLYLPGGTYYFRNISISGKGTLIFTGAATIYAYGSINVSGSTNTSGNLPGNLKIITGPDPSGTPPGSVYVGSSSALYADLYAPLSDVTLGGSGDIYGSVLGLSVTMSGTSAIHYDLSLNASNGESALVQ